MLCVIQPQYVQLRAVFASPDDFIDDAVYVAEHTNIDGFNIDFEPCQTKGSVCTEQDALQYAAFLNLLADRLHLVNKTLTVDVASWYL